MLSSTIFAFVTALATASTASAHMMLWNPPPYRSKNMPGITYDQIDYSMTSPLGAYPCKGYIDPSVPSVATWAAGSTINYELQGTAVHGGGSCQIVLSYDQGQTWNVIYSIIGGCVIDSLTESVTIPKDAPSGEAIFGWTWFNQVGNREMYQNCAPVTITDGGSGLNSDDYPAPFVANVDAAPGCGTEAGVDVVFPHPGKNVKYGGAYKNGNVPVAGAGITGTCASGAETPPPANGGGNTGPEPSSASSASEAGSTLYSGSSTGSASASSTASATASTTSLTSPGDFAAEPTSSSTSALPSASSGAAAAPSAPASSATPAKKCKRKRSQNTIAPARRHERLVRRSAHERLVRRRVRRDVPAQQFSS